MIGSLGAAYTQKSYNINSLYDPETGALNQQNLYFNEYMLLYRKYRVFKVDYAITIWNTTVNSAVTGSISFDEQGNQMGISDIQQLSKPYSKRFSLAPAGNTGSFKTIRGSIYLPRVLGLTPEQFRTSVGVDATWGGKDANPSRVIQLSINARNVNPGAVANLQAEARYTCHCEFFDRDTGVVGTDAPVEEA